MYEITISAPSSDRYMLNHICDKMDFTVKQMCGKQTVANCGQRCYACFACDEIFRNVMDSEIAQAVAESIAVGYKNRFVRQLLNVDDNCNFFQNVLVNVICVFDSMPDKQVVCGQLDVSKPIFLDGYYNFCLSRLKRKWAELTKLVGANRYVLEDDSLVLEFLQYLVDSVSQSKGAVSVVLEENEFFVFDQQGNVLPTLSMLSADISVEEELVVNLVCIKPSSVQVHCKQMPSAQLCKTLQRLFVTDFKLS